MRVLIGNDVLSRFDSFRHLVSHLKELGVVVDHFHAVKLVEIGRSEYCSDPKNGHEAILREDGEIHFYEEEVTHLNLVRNEETREIIDDFPDGFLKADPSDWDTC